MSASLRKRPSANCRDVPVSDLGQPNVLRETPPHLCYDEFAILRGFMTKRGPAKGKAPATRKPGSESSDLKKEVAALKRELAEAKQREAATAEVLKVISCTAFDLRNVLNTLAASAAKLCDAEQAFIFQRDGDAFHFAVSYGLSGEFDEYARQNPMRPGRGTITGRAALERQTVHITDVLADPEYDGVGYQMHGRYRSGLGVPLLRDGETFGVFGLTRTDVRPFTDKQIELASTFADQAAIAIENARLFEEVQSRTKELTESLEQQTATSEVLKVISRSAFDLQVVLDTLVKTAVRLSGARTGTIFQERGGLYHLTAQYGYPPEILAHGRAEPIAPGMNSSVGRSAIAGAVIQIPDVFADPDFRAFGYQRLGNFRALMAVPLIREGKVDGVFSLGKPEAGPFAQRQVELLQTFADQAVIAIENARLVSELRESLQQQTVTADVLKIISRSTFNLQTVLDTLVHSAAKLCRADNSFLFRREDGNYIWSASYGYSDEYLDYMKARQLTPERGTATGRAALDGQVVHIPDVFADSEYTWWESQKVGRYRAVLAIPLVREGISIGVLGLTRLQPQAFTNKQIDLMTTFADQAVIAIENVRLFDEIQHKGRQLEIASQHKSQFLANMSHELRTPLNAILGYTELILDSIYGEPTEKMRGVLERLQANGKHLLNLINDVLDLSKIEAGQLTLDLGGYSLTDVVYTVVTAVEPLATAKALTLSADVSKELPTGHGDGRRLTQVLLNLVGNAIKFTDQGQVTIKANASDGEFTVAVCDTGPGISLSDQAKLFQEFQQADNSITRQKGGTGLGLAISKRIIEMHGGRIWVESEIGNGAKFTFTVPVRAQRQVANDG